MRRISGRDYIARGYKTPPEEVMESVREAYQRGQTLEALRLAEAFAPLREWWGVEGCTAAAKIAANTGAPGLATRLSARAWRLDRAHPLAQLYYGFEVQRWRGSMVLWLAMQDWPPARECDPQEEADLLGLRGTTAAELRDFGAAEKLLERAECLAPKDAWVRLQRARLLELQDRVEEALEVAEMASGLHPHPWYRVGVQTRAHLLQLLDRDEDAIQLLQGADGHLQNGPVAGQLYTLLAENGRWKEAESSLQRLVELSPLMEKPLKEWVTAQRARTGYHLGKRAEAARLAAELDDEFHQSFAKALATAPEVPERVHLEVTFVRQHFKTCAPATLAALGSYWGFPAEHLKLAEAMCYDGTPSWQQREWAEKNGWMVREFRVTQESARELLTRGIPFGIATVEAVGAHMMAMAGFDRTRNTMLLRDPGQPYIAEAAAEEFFKRYRPFGPHGMVFLPVAEKARLDGVSLPDAEAYDERHKIWLALAKHERGRAAEVLAALERRFPDHEQVWDLKLELAAYDANTREQLRWLDIALERYPDNAPRLLRRLSCMRDATRDEQLQFLERACSGKSVDPALLVELARNLQMDARCATRARECLRRALRLGPMASNTITALADLEWQEGRLERATELYRFAANLEGFRENLYRTWFLACRATGRRKEALEHLEDRFKRFGSRSEQPAITLAWALQEMEEPARAREVLTEAARLRPEDGSLLLRAAGLVAGFGERVEAERLLNLAKGKVRESDWLRTAAEMAENRLDTAAALKWCRELLRQEPLALDGHAGVARCLARLEGTAAAVAHLQAACEEFPHHYPLRRTFVEWSRSLGPATQEGAVRDLLRMDPADAWGRRELAVVLSCMNRNEEALREALEAAAIEPRNSFSFSVLGHIHVRLQQPEDARRCFRRAIELSVDNTDAIHALLDVARTDKERKEELQFVERELVQQVVQGHGLWTFLELARPVMEPEKLLNNLRTAHRERPDLWHAWLALVSQLRHLGHLDEARDLAQQATARFPHLPLVWLEKALVHQWRKEPEEEIKALERAFDLNPGWARSTVTLADAWERHDRLEEARVVFQRALQHSPQDAQIHASHGHLLWRLREQDAALAAVEQALRLAPRFDWPWGLLLEWGEACGQPGRAADFARALTRERPGEMQVWLMLARVLKDPAALSERLDAVAKAVELDPLSTEAWNLKAELLAGAECFNEAIRACQEGEAVCTSQVHILRGQRAWIEACRRQYPEAVRLMREVLAENASYTWGWNQLAAWLLELGQIEEAAVAVEQLQRLSPRDPWVYRQLGFLRLKKKDQKGAREAFAEALQLAPEDAYSAQNIFDLQLQANDLQGAAATLRVMEIHQPGVRTLALDAFLRLRTGEQAAADSALENLCAALDPDPWPVEAVTDALMKAGRTERAKQILRAALKQPSCNPQTGAAFVRLCTAQGQSIRAVFSFARFKPGELQRRAAGPLVQGLARLGSKVSLRWLLWRRREVLARDDTAWGWVGYAFLSFKWRKQVIRWMSDWPSRANVEPWMVFNLCVALRHYGRYDEANRLANHVLQHWGHREGAADMRLFAALEDALAGNESGASAHLEKATARSDSPYDQDLLALAKALVEFQQVPLAERLVRFGILRDQLARRFTAQHLAQSTRDVRRSFRRAGKFFAQNGAGWRARWWFLRKQVW